MITVILQITREDNELISRIYLELGGKMLCVSKRILRSDTDAQDAVQEAFVRISKNIERISALPCPQIAPYCIIIVKNVSLRMLQKSGKILYMDSLEQVQGDTADTAEDEAARKMQKDAMLRLVAALPPEDRMLLHLHWEMGMGFSAVADYMEISEEAAKKRSQRIIKKLREQLEGGHEYAGIL